MRKILIGRERRDKMEKKGQILGKTVSGIPVMFIVIALAAVFIVACVMVSKLKNPTQSLTDSVSAYPVVYNTFFFNPVYVKVNVAGSVSAEKKTLLFDAFLDELDRIKYPAIGASNAPMIFLNKYDSDYFNSENCFFAIVQLIPAQALDKNGLPRKGFGEIDYFGDEENDFYNSPVFYNKNKFAKFDAWDVFQDYSNAGKNVEYFDAYWDRNGKKDLLEFYVYNGECLE